MIAEVVIYKSSNIIDFPFCKLAREFFDSECIEYQEVDVAKDEDIRAKLIKITKRMHFLK